MLPLNYVINSTILSKNIITTSSVYHQLIVNNQQQRDQTRRRRKTTTTIPTTIATSSFLSLNTTNIYFSLSSPTSSTQHQQNSFEDSYSAKTGIKTAALLGGMLFLVILYLIWKARARLCRALSGHVNNPRLSATKFDLDYWLKQVDLLEAKEAERNRGGQSLYLELPHTEPRDNREATATWIVDAYRQWRLLQYRHEQQYFRDNSNQSSHANPMIYRKRRNLIRRFVRRFITSPHQRSSFLMKDSSSIIAGMRPSLVSYNVFPLPIESNLPPRRASSWPRLKSSRHQTGASMSALQTHLARKRLLKRTSRTLDI